MATPMYIFMVYVYFLIFYLTPFVVAKILVMDGRLRLKESVYILLASMFCAAIRLIPNFTFIVISPEQFAGERSFFIFFVMFSGLLHDFFFFLYFYKLKSYSAKKAVILAIFASLFLFIAVFMVNFVFQTFLGLHSDWLPEQAFLAISNTLSILIISALVTFLFIKTSGKLRKAINERTSVQTALTFGSSVSWLIVQVVSVVRFISGSSVNEFWVSLLVLGYIGASIISFFFYSRYVNERFAVRQKEDEQKDMLFYMDEIERQQLAIRKFKHDQQNLFSTIDIYIQNKDWDGLMQFYPKVRVASEIITKNEFELEGLSKIKVREIKNILIAKLVTAQDLKLNTRLEIGEEIDDIPVDSVALVRMLGIILDNAIEELQLLDEGQLIIGCFKIDGSVNIVVQNTCRPDVPPLRQIQQLNFSTKGKGRGLGLSNLYELTSSLPNVALLTSIEDGHFTQRLMIGGVTT